MVLLQTCYSVVLPIFIVIGTGWLLDRRFRLDLPTLSKLNFYIFVPALVFVKILETDLVLHRMGRVGAFALVHSAVLFALAWFAFSRGKMRAQRRVMTLGAVFLNSGNYGIPFVILAFGDAYVGVIAIVLVDILLNNGS